MESAYGKEHTRTARAYHIQGRIMAAQRKPDKAVPVLFKAVEIIEEMYGEHHAETAKVSADYGWSLLQAGDASAAAEILAAADQVFGATIGMQHPGILTIQRNLAQAHMANGNTAEAARSFIHLARTSGQQKNHALQYEAYATVVAVYTQAGLFDEAGNWLDKANEAKDRTEDDLLSIEQLPLFGKTLQSLIANDQVKEAMELNVAVLALSKAMSGNMELREIAAAYREHLDPDRIEYLLEDTEVFAMQSLLPDMTAFTVTSDKGLKLLNDAGLQDLDDLISKKRPGMTLVTVDDILNRTVDGVRQDREDVHEAVAASHEQLAAQHQAACNKIQQEMMGAINKATAEGKYELIPQLTMEMTEKINALNAEFEKKMNDLQSG